MTVTLEDVIHILGLQVNEDLVTGRSDSSHQFFVENCIACFGQQPSPDDHVLGKVKLAWPGVAETLNRVTRRSLLSGTLGLTFSACLVQWCFQISLPRLLGAASLAHLYRSLCRASRYNCKEMNVPLILFFVWAWERMPFMALISRNELFDDGVPLTRWWSHWRWHARYTRRSAAQFKRGLDDMGVNDYPLCTSIAIVSPDLITSFLSNQASSDKPITTYTITLAFRIECLQLRLIHSIINSSRDSVAFDCRYHRLSRTNSIPTLNSPSSAATLPSPTTCAPPSVREGK
ncbi:hypothetical protein AHAS_Ahas07G0159300 [Arachis hypogaea]